MRFEPRCTSRRVSLIFLMCVRAHNVHWAKSREVTGPDSKIDGPTGSWTRDGFGSSN